MDVPQFTQYYLSDQFIIELTVCVLRQETSGDFDCTLWGNK